MRFGIHLPQYGRAAGPESIERAAQQAEALGLDDVWVSDHQVVPAALEYPPAFQYDPLMTLAWAGAATRRVGLGTSVLVLPQYGTVALANSLASLDRLCAGRLTLGAGVGWLEGEFRALGASFANRGRRMDEMIDVLRACWQTDPTSFSGEFHQLDAIRLLPKPQGSIPIWLGGSSERAYARAVAKGDGFQLTRVSAAEAAPLVERLRGDRPESEFTLSVRVEWDGLRSPADEIRRELEGYASAGIQHLMATPGQRTIDDWLRSVEALSSLFEPLR